jgi:RNA polymerase sigma factor (sigma-70 family)
MQINTYEEPSMEHVNVTADETINMGKGLPKNDIVKQMFRYHSLDSQIREAATAEIINDYTKFISYIINTRYASYKSDWEELMQQGVLGILNALQTYDPELSKPTTYFYSYIVHELTDYVSNYKSTVSPYYAAQINKVKNSISELEKKGIPYSEHEISVLTGYSIESVCRILELINHINILHYESDDYLESCLTQNEKSPEAHYIINEQNRIIHNALLCLPTIERKIVLLKIGFSIEKQTYKAIAKQINLPVEQVKQLYQQALQKLRRHPEMRKEFGDYANRYNKEILNGIQIHLFSEHNYSVVTDSIEEICF